MVYADETWFGTPFRIVDGIDELEHYFLVMADSVDSCTFEDDGIPCIGIDYDVRWTMRFVSKAAKGETIEALGMVHVGFDKQGKVIFQ